MRSHACRRPSPAMLPSTTVLDLRFVVENRERVLAALLSRGQTLEQIQSWPGLQGVDPWTLDGERRAAIKKVEELRHRQRLAGEEIARRGREKQDASELKAEMRGVADEIKTLEVRQQEVEDAIRRFLLVVPNLPDPSVPVGPDASANAEVRRQGEPKRFEFAPRAHWDL